MNEGNEPQAPRFRPKDSFETAEGEAVNNRDGSVGKFVKHRAIRARCKLDDFDGAPTGAQTLDNVTIEQISAGQLIETARDDEDQFGHPSGAS
jgi:hypothetical protein